MTAQPFARQIIRHARIDAGLDLRLALIGEGARSVDRFLQRHALLIEPHHQMRMAAGLILPAHHPKGQDRACRPA